MENQGLEEKNYWSGTLQVVFSFVIKHFLIFRKYIQCRSRWMIIKAANKRLVTLCMFSHWLLGMFRYNDQLFPLPPPEGRTRYSTSPEMSEGMKVTRQPISTRALIVIFLIWYLIKKKI